MTNENPIGLVTVRTSSSRLPQKCLLPFGGDNVLCHIIRRARAFGIEPIVCTSLDDDDDVIHDIAIKEGVRCFRGSLRNKLKRWSDCASYFDLKAFHTIDADDPFFDGEEMRASMLLLAENEVDVVCPSEVSSAGAGSVGYSLTANIVRRGLSGIPEGADTEMIWGYLQKIPDLRSCTLPNNPLTPTNIRLTLDYEEDYWLLETVRKILGNLAPRRDIDRLFMTNPDLHKVNWFRNAEWKSAQIAKSL